MSKSSAEIDPLLEPLLQPGDDDRADDLLSQLITTHAEPVIRAVIRSKLHLNSHQGQADSNDLRQEAVTQLIAAIRQFRERPDLRPISDLRGLAAVIAHRACSGWMRRRFPQRHSFKNRLYYLLTRQRGFALWRNRNNRMVAGFAAWRDREDAVTGEQLAGMSNDERLAARIRSLDIGRRSEWSDALAEILDYLGGPVDFEAFVGTLAAFLQIEDQPVESTDQIEDPGGFLIADRQPDASLQVEKRIFLERLWEEVRLLPPNQRAALLLNLKDPEGKGCIALLPAIGIATFRQLAEVLGMGAERLAEIWNDLPLEDEKIAGLLQLTRQQIINARKSARERLARRLKGFI
ncbi:MAG: hypothetical protein IPM66_22230 [Acidobacteriota bacterium]|nr:MAG: hypothetical protein IPM66_22230 [Acidobacteriota bacterium]